MPSGIKYSLTIAPGETGIELRSHTKPGPGIPLRWGRKEGRLLGPTFTIDLAPTASAKLVKLAVAWDSHAGDYDRPNEITLTNADIVRIIRRRPRAKRK